MQNKGDFVRQTIRLLLPVGGALLTVLSYILLPNYQALRGTNMYVWLIGLFIAFYLGLTVISTRKASLRRILLYRAPLCFAFTLLFLLWDVLTLKMGMLPQPYFPWPDKIINALVNDQRILLESILHSMRLLGLGYFYGATIGFVCGVVMGWYSFFSYWLTPVMRIFGPIPAVAWIPMVMILAPSSFAGSAFIIALAVWFPVTLLTYSGVSGVRKAYIEVAKTLGARQGRLILRVAIPAALPHIFIGLFQGIIVSCVTLIVAEMMGVEAGLGWYITWAMGWAEYDKVFASLFLIFLIFSGIIRVLFTVRDRVLSWQKGVIKW